MIEAWVRVGNRNSLSRLIDKRHPILDAAKAQCPDTMNKSMWDSICSLILYRTSEIDRMIGTEKFSQMKYIVWAKNFPEHKIYRDYIMNRGSPRHYVKTAKMIEVPKSMQELITAKKICDDTTGLSNDIRVADSDSWIVVENIRRAGKLRKINIHQKSIIDALGGPKALKMPDRQYPDRLWFKKDGKEFSQLLLTKTIILAKTLSALKDTSFKYQEMFTQNYPNVENSHQFHRSEFVDSLYTFNIVPVAAIIVHKKNGNYDKALKALQNAGYTVHEADEPQKPVKAASSTLTPRPSKTYPLYDPMQDDWADWDNAVENPTCYITITEHKVKNGYRTDLPDRKLMAWVYQNTPRFVVIHNKARLTKKFDNIPTYQMKLHELVCKILEDKDKVEKIRLHYLFKKESRLPDKIRELPEVQKFFGIPYLRTAQKNQLLEDMETLLTVQRCRYTQTDTLTLIHDSLSVDTKTDSVSLVRKRMEALELFNNYRMSSHINGMKPGEVKVFSEKLMRFLRTV